MGIYIDNHTFEVQGFRLFSVPELLIRAYQCPNEGVNFMSYGYTGRILHIDLTNRNIKIEEKDDAFYRSYLGGRGIGYHYLIKMVSPGIDPLASDNILVLATGVMTGSPLAAS